MRRRRRDSQTGWGSGQPASGAVLGIDPGLERTGYSVLSECDRPEGVRLTEAGVVRLDREQPIERRLVHLAESVEALIRAHSPGVLACEELYAHYRHPRTAILMAQARGVILASAARCGLEILAVASTHVKKVLTGSGRASKQQVQRAVAATLGLPTIPEPHDVADAIAIALCGVRLRRAAARLRAGAAREVGT